MIFIITEQFNLSKSVKVLYSKGKVLKKDLKTFFDQACNKNGRFLGSEDKIENEGVVYSFRFFKKNVEPSFLNGSRYEEEKFGYCLVVEYQNYILISSKYCSLNEKKLKLIGQIIPFSDFSKFLPDENTEFQKVNLKNTSVLPSAITNRSIEGNDLARTFSPVYASKNIVRSCKMENAMGAFSQNLTSSRLTNYTGKSNLNEFLKWCKGLIDFVTEERDVFNYLNNFSFSVKYEEERDSLMPDSIMFDLRYLPDSEYTFFDESGEKIEVSKILKVYSSTFELFYDKKRDVYFAEIDEQTNITVQKLKSKIKITISNKITVEDEDGEKNFEEILADNSIIIFEDIKYSYYAKTLFVDTYLVNNKRSFLDNFIVIDDLDDTNSEKGNISEEAVNFDDASVFGVLEKYLNEQDYTYIFCDDLGTEYADFIACSENTIGFYVAKSSKSLFSASAFHDVVGQALKNLSYISNLENIVLDERNNPRKLTTKKEVWSRKYKNNKIETKINRLRKPQSDDINTDVTNGIELVRKANSSGQTIKKVVLVVDFISKKQLEQEIDDNTNKELKQVLWILSSFISSCQELSLVPQILCKE